MTKQKVFCVGMNKTGTSSMHLCFKELGLVPVARPGANRGRDVKLFKRIVEQNDYATALAYAQDFVAFEDRPWNVWEMYRRADESFLGSKFILTYRDPESWWRSVERWLTVRKPHMLDRYMKHLKVTQFSKSAFIDGYESYNNEVVSYFQDAENFLILNFADGDGWGKLCPFLEKPIPARPFPHKNRQRYSEAKQAESDS